ncbi:MAG: IPExxxVDY family protein [Bacteroidales bacterium]
MNKYPLNIDCFTSEEYQLIGISSHSKEYRLAFFINKTLGIDLRRQRDLNTSGRPTDEISPYSLFYYPEEENDHSFYLLSNRNKKTKLIKDKDYTAIDYFFVIRRKFENSRLRELIKGLLKINLVQTAFLIEIDAIKDFLYVLTDLEEQESHFMKKSVL